MIDDGAVKIAGAPADEGMGRFDLDTVTVSSSIASGALERTYRSDSTRSAVVGPQRRRARLDQQQHERIIVRKALNLCLLPALLAAFAAGAGSAAAEQGSMDFTAEPAPRSSLAAGGYFRISSGPGETVEQAIVLRNLSQRPSALRVSAVDATTGPYGGVSYGLPADAGKRVGKWITVERQTVRLAPGEARRVSFTVTVPAGTASGEHLGGITVSAPPNTKIQETKSGAGQAGASLNIQTRRVIAVLVRVPGPAEPRLVVTGVTPAARADGAYLEIAIENRGGALTKATGIASLSGDGFKERFALDTVVPGTAIVYPLKWTLNPRGGEHRATVELRYGTQKARWSGTFTIGEKVEKALLEKGAPGEVRKSPDGTLTLALTAAAAAATTGLLGLIIWLIAWRRRKRADRRPPSSGERDDAIEENSPLVGAVITERGPPAAPAGRGERAVAVHAAPPAHREGMLRNWPLAARPSVEPSAAAPLAAATAVAVGSALWLLSRRRGSGGRS